jgi:hypothetical protein
MSYRLPNEPGRYIDVRTDYEAERYHFRHDTQAKSFDLYAVSLPPWLNEPGLLAPTFEAALTTLRHLRSLPLSPLYPPDIFIPMGVIVATSLDVVSRDVAIQIALLEGGVDDANPMHPDHDARVAALARALALVRGLPLPTPSPDGWKNLKVASL